ncbi:hypothetical protein [Avibacterium paragallinarum]|uniref:Uncharacterized protein n=1 Tax=Avibacterium paragallinarum TaxID=728 RepID=A0A0F5EYR6_AVIPA|nr:hypothetical protein [Avibacterium paragallinarum]KAA6210005.1 hypothetical protein F1968_00820 [Avibacterium paragallinarum]KKB01774.1 hypothetical protein Z012_04505 [Avibacterium paragallinarum]RZN60259.1 hypothetical protein EIG79_04110 [Avibacterium paragallinarum]RZN74163.1 hypothetical protein EIG77_00585 [Avibacterium paragallinarum]SUU97701.1 Uncharacterised protein [Avibacterium paragallinarum]
MENQLLIENKMENENLEDESLEEVLEKIKEATEPCTATKVAVFAGQTALVAGIAYAGYCLYDYFCSSE